jgi:transcription-repair coupling factor (superfamily II helicase)
LEAYRRLAAATTPDDVDDVATEWVDRYGPMPGPALGLLDLARLRVECLRLGISDIAVSVARVGGPSRSLARISPLTLTASAQIRLKRLAPGSDYREEMRQVVVPLTSTSELAGTLRALLGELLPPPDPPETPGDEGSLAEDPHDSHKGEQAGKGDRGGRSVGRGRSGPGGAGR